jgi:hypothetical protein
MTTVLNPALVSVPKGKMYEFTARPIEHKIRGFNDDSYFVIHGGAVLKETQEFLKEEFMLHGLCVFAEKAVAWARHHDFEGVQVRAVFKRSSKRCRSFPIKHRQKTFRFWSETVGA